MRPFYTFTSLVLCALVLAACGPRDRVYNPVHFQPAGVMIPPQIIRTRKMDGVFTEKADPDLTGICCWIAPHAGFYLNKSAAARRLHLSGYVPVAPQFQKRPQRITLAFSGLGWRHVANFHQGFQSVSVPLPAALRRRQGDVLVTLDCSIPFLTAGQRYGIVLTSVYFE